MKKRFLVIGLGVLGQSVAKTLAEDGAEVIAVDQSPYLVDAIKDLVTLAVQCDATDRAALKQLGVNNLDAAVVCIGEGFESTVLATANLLDLGVKRVAARANNEMSASILRRIGAHDVFFIESEMGKALAHKLNRPSIAHEMDLGDGYRILEWKTPPALKDQKLADLNLPQKFRVHVIAIRSSVESESITIPTGDTVLMPQDLLLIIGHSRDTERLFQTYRDQQSKS